MSNVLHSALLGADIHKTRLDVFAGVPSTTPLFVGQTQFDSSSDAIYVAINTTGPGDWVTQSIPAPLTVSPGSPNTVNLVLSSNVLSATVNISVLNPLLTLTYSQISNFFTGVAAATISTSQLSGTVAIANGGTNLSATPSNGQLLIGNATGYTLNTLTGTTNQINVVNGTGTITLSLPQSIATSSSPTFTSLTLTGSLEGNTTLNLATVSTTILNLGTGPSVLAVNLGISSGTTLLNGSSIGLVTSTLNTTSLTLALNHTGGAASGANSGIQVQESGVVDGYILTSSDRNSWVMKTLTGSGNVTFTPGSLDILINQDLRIGASPSFASVVFPVSSTITTTTTLTTSYGTYPINTSGSPFTVTLPSASSAGIGFQFTIVDVGGVVDVNNLTIMTAGSDTLNGASTFIMNSEYESVTLQVTNTTVWSVV